MLRSCSFVCLVFALPLAACQTAAVNPPGTAMAATEAQLKTEAVAFGTTQAAVGLATELDPTGLSSLGVMAAGNAAHKTWMTSAQARLEAAREADLQAQYRKYGLNPDGTPSGKPGPGSAR